MKAKWNKPTLVILSRGNPEEMVLEFCKSVHGGQEGPSGGQNKCDTMGQGQDSCGSCRSNPDKGS
jgi:hypothetical protein